MGLEMVPMAPTCVNAASKGSSMTVVGRVKDVRMVLKEEYIVHSVLVLEGLSHPVNIGLKFLQQNYATIFLTPESVTLQLGQTKMNLVKKNHIGKQRGELDLIQKQKLVQKASVKSAPSCGSQSRETESRMRDPEKVLDQDEDSDLVQRIASNICTRVFID